MKRLTLILALGAGAALAHSGATGVVKERMDAMSGIAKSTKTLGEMAKSGVIDPTKVQEASAAIAAAARDMPAKFEVKDVSKPSEALPAIWQDFDDFIAKADALAAAAETLPGASDAESYRASFAAMGKACSSCHESYRQPQ